MEKNSNDITFEKGDIRLKSIKFDNHPILGDLEVDFCDNEGKPVDTIIIAGENGTGKSTLINALFSITENKFNSNLQNSTLKIMNKTSNKELSITYKNDSPDKRIRIVKGVYYTTLSEHTHFKRKFPLSAIFSDVDINFTSGATSTVTTLEIDQESESRRSSHLLATEMKQLLIDINSLDDGDFSKLAEEYQKNGKNINELMQQKGKRIKRFTNAFEFMFKDIKFSKVINNNNAKDVIFLKNDKPVSIDKLSSGEKQIVFRNSFLLKDQNALEGAFVFIDEPEISLHPEWQKRVLENYKRIFTNEHGEQTSQLFVVTHSPFIIHNEHRQNDKVIVLSRDKSGKIVVSDKPEYYKCTSKKAVQDAFYISDFSNEKSVVYLEGETDENYFRKAVEIYGLNVPFEFHWVGYKDERGNDQYTGESCVEKAFHFLKAQNLSSKNICLCDCDVSENKEKCENNAHLVVLQQYKNVQNIKKGIENALCLDGFDLENFRIYKEKDDGYGGQWKVPELQKTKLCSHICSLPPEQLKEIFVNLKTEIEKLVKIFEMEDNE